MIKPCWYADDHVWTWDADWILWKCPCGQSRFEWDLKARPV